MAIVPGDWSIDNATGNIRYIGGDHGASPSYATVIELHRFLQDLADDASFSGDDELDITVATPSDRSTDNIITLINGFNIDDNAAEHLYDGSIIQAGGAEIYDGIVNFGNTSNIQIIQNGAVLADDWWNSNGGLNSDAAAGISHRFLIKVRTAGADIDGRRLIGTSRQFGSTYSEFKINGSTRGNNVLALSETNDLNNETAEGTVSGWTTITNTTEGYANIDVTGDGADEFYYSEWNRDSFSINQFYERMKWLTREGSASTLYGLNGELFRGITHEIVVDAPTGTFNAFEPVSWSGGTGQMLAINSPTAATKMWIQLLTGIAPTNDQVITGGTSSATATVNVTVTERSISAPFIGQSTGSAIIGAYGVGIESADLTAADSLFDLDNVNRNPPNNVSFSVSGLVSGEDRVLVAPLAYFVNYDGEGGTPPWQEGETITFSGGGSGTLRRFVDNGTDGTLLFVLNSGSVPVNDETITGGTSGTTAAVNGAARIDIDVEQLSNNALLNGATVTSIVCSSAIPTDTPSSGTLRIERASGVFSSIAYSSYTGSTFTITSTDFSTDNAVAGAGIYVSYIDKLATGTSESFTSVYLADRSLFVRVRDGGGSPIRTFETTGTLGSAGGSSTAIRTADV